MTKSQRKKYQSLDSTIKKLSQLLGKMKKSGELMLPAERVLCEKLHCSRETLRRVLEDQEAKGIIVKKGRARSLSMDVVVPSAIGSFAFVSEGQGMVSNPAWNKLWSALSEQAEKENVAAKLILVPGSASEEDCRKLFRDLPEIIVMTTINNSFVKKLISEMSDKTVITTEEHYRGVIQNIITMNNYEAGFLAAKKLAEHGYRKPAIICNKLISDRDELYIPYERRVIGFIDGCKKFGLEIGEESEFWISGKKYKVIVKIIKAASSIVSNGFDSVFLHTDNNIDFLYEALIEECRIPEDVGLITVNSFDHAVMHNPPISAVSHGTMPVTATLIEQIKQIIESGEKNVGEILVEPTFHKGETLK